MVSGPTAAVINATAPVNTTPPSISGSAVLGVQLTVSNGSWSGTPAPTFKYQWQKCDANGANCADISGATAQSYTLAAADVGNKVLAIVTASNTAGSAAKASAVTGVVAAPPANTAKPVVSGNAMVGQVLTTTAGTWTGSQPLTPGYQWIRCDANGAGCSDIAGATGTTYTLVVADANHRLKARVSMNNGAGSQSAESAVTAVIAAPAPPSVRGLPALHGRAVVGQTLSASTGSWNGTQPISVAVKWRRCNAAGAVCLDIPGATTTAYRVTGNDLGSRLQAVVTASNAGGQATLATGASSRVILPVTTSVLAQRVVFLPRRARIRLDLIQVRRSSGLTLSLALDRWSGGAWRRQRTVHVASSSSQVTRLLLFRARPTGTSATITIRWRLNPTHVGFFSYAADTTTLRRASRIVAAE
jgi:hypothetical protein